MTGSGRSNSPPPELRAAYRTHLAFVRSTLRRLGVAPHCVEDAAQDVFLVAHRRWVDYEGPSLEAWLYGISRRVASNARRAARRRRAREVVATLRTMRPIESRVPPRELLQALELFLERLTPAERRLFVLSELEGMTGPEIAELLERNVQTIYTRVRRLRRRFREEVGREHLPSSAKRSWLMLAFGRPWMAAAKGGPGLTAVLFAGAIAVTGTLHAHRMPAAHERKDLEPPSSQPRQARGSSVERPREMLPSSAAPLPDPVGLPEGTPRAPIRSEVTSRTRVQKQHEPRSLSGDLALENELLSRAEHLIDQGFGHGAYRLIERHERDFPSSELSDLRAALRVEALCLVGKEMQARGEATLFLQRHPSSPFARRVSESCARSSYSRTRADKGRG